jgi:hypothetical protein
MNKVFYFWHLARLIFYSIGKIKTKVHIVSLQKGTRYREITKTERKREIITFTEEFM